MPEAFIFDHVRTPRGRGKPDGALHEITPIQLAAQTLGALRDRNQLDTALVDDVVHGLRRAGGRAGLRHRARRGAGRELRADRAGSAAESLLCFGPRGREQCRGAGDVRASRMR